MIVLVRGAFINIGRLIVLSCYMALLSMAFNDMSLNLTTLRRETKLISGLAAYLDVETPYHANTLGYLYLQSTGSSKFRTWN